MSKQPRNYSVGYGRPPLHSRFRKGTSGNPAGGRHRAKGLASVLQEALDQPVERAGDRMVARTGEWRGARRQPTRREAIVAGLVERSAAGDLRATKLLLDLVMKTELAAGPAPFSGADEDPRQFLLRELARLSAASAANSEAGSGDQAELPIQPR
jgi:hypothetical protein